MAYVVAGYYAGLANGIDSGMDRSILDERLKKVFPELDDVWMKEIVISDERDELWRTYNAAAKEIEIQKDELLD